MSNYLAEAFAPAEARYAEEVRAATWGHLAPRKNVTYRGHIVFAVGIFGSDDLNPVPIECEFQGADDELESSPWFYEALQGLLQGFCDLDDRGQAKSGGVYRWDGTFRNYKWKGGLRRLELHIAGT